MSGDHNEVIHNHCKLLLLMIANPGILLDLELQFG